MTVPEYFPPESGRPPGPGLPAQAHLDESSSAAPQMASQTLLHLLVVCLPCSPQSLGAPAASYSSANLQGPAHGGHTASVHLTNQGKRMNVCSLLFLNFIQQQISRKCFCWHFVTQLPYIMSRMYPALCGSWEGNVISPDVVKMSHV